MSKKLIVVFLVITIPPILASMMFTFWEVSARLEVQTLEQLDDIATKQGNRVNSFFMKWTEKTSDFSSRGELRILLNDLQEGYSDESKDKVNDLLLSYKENFIEIEKLFVVNDQGAILASTDEGETGKKTMSEYGVGIDLLQRNIFVLKEQVIGGDYATGLFFSRQIKSTGEKIYLVLEVETSEIIAIARDYSALGKTGETVLGDVATSGEVIFLSPLRFDNEYHKMERVNVENKDIPIVQALEGEQILITEMVDYRGKEVFAATKHLDLSGWGVVVKIDKEEALSILDELKISYVIVAAVALLLVSFVAWYYARIITRPIVKLSEVTRKIARSRKFKSRVEVESEDELGQLAVNFNAMLEEVEGSYDELESRVKDRTKELDQNVEKLKRMNKVMLGRELKMIELKKEIKKYEKKGKTK